MGRHKFVHLIRKGKLSESPVLLAGTGPQRLRRSDESLREGCDSDPIGVVVENLNDPQEPLGIRVSQHDPMKRVVGRNPLQDALTTGQIAFVLMVSADCRWFWQGFKG